MNIVSAFWSRLLKPLKILAVIIGFIMLAVVVALLIEVLP